MNKHENKDKHTYQQSSLLPQTKNTEVLVHQNTTCICRLPFCDEQSEQTKEYLNCKLTRFIDKHVFLFLIVSVCVLVFLIISFGVLITRSNQKETRSQIQNESFHCDVIEESIITRPCYRGNSLIRTGQLCCTPIQRSILYLLKEVF